MTKIKYSRSLNEHPSDESSSDEEPLSMDTPLTHSNIINFSPLTPRSRKIAKLRAEKKLDFNGHLTLPEFDYGDHSDNCSRLRSYSCPPDLLPLNNLNRTKRSERNIPRLVVLISSMLLFGLILSVDDFEQDYGYHDLNPANDSELNNFNILPKNLKHSNDGRLRRRPNVAYAKKGVGGHRTAVLVSQLDLLSSASSDQLNQLLEVPVLGLCSVIFLVVIYVVKKRTR